MRINYEIIISIVDVIFVFLPMASRVFLIAVRCQRAHASPQPPEQKQKLKPHISLHLHVPRLELLHDRQDRLLLVVRILLAVALAVAPLRLRTNLCNPVPHAPKSMYNTNDMIYVPILLNAINS